MEDGSVVIGTDLTPEEAFQMLNKWGTENDDKFKAFYDEEMKNGGNTNNENAEDDVTDNGKCNSKKPIK